MVTHSVQMVLLNMSLIWTCRLSCMAVWQSSHCMWPSTHRYVSDVTLEWVFTIRTSSPHGCLPLLTTAGSHVQAVVHFCVQVIVEQAFSGNLDHVKHALVSTGHIAVSHPLFGCIRPCCTAAMASCPVEGWGTVWIVIMSSGMLTHEASLCDDAGPVCRLCCHLRSRAGEYHSTTCLYHV